MTNALRVSFLALLMAVVLAGQPIQATRMSSGDRLYDGNNLTTDQGAYTLSWATYFRAGCPNSQMRSLIWIDNSVPQAVWSSMSDDSFEAALGSHQDQYQCSAYVLHMQSDGNLVIYTNSNENVDAWSTSTSGNSDASFSLQDDGNLVIYTSSEVPIWSIL